MDGELLLRLRRLQWIFSSVENSKMEGKAKKLPIAAVQILLSIGFSVYYKVYTGVTRVRHIYE